MINYVLGFAFDLQRRNVLLICKDHPDWQQGFFNGIGGKIEYNELPETTMNRESTEEVGLASLPWRHFATLFFRDATVYVYRAFTDEIYQHRQKTRERPTIYDIHSLTFRSIPLVRDADTLIQLAKIDEMSSIKLPVQFDCVFKDGGEKKAGQR